MKISNKFNESVIKKFLSFLFIDSDRNYFERSKILAIVSKFDSPRLAFACLCGSIACLWYESFFNQIGFTAVEKYNFAIIFLALALLFCDKKRILSTKSSIYLVLFTLLFAASGLLAATRGLELGMLISGLVIMGQFVVGYFVGSTIKHKKLLIDVALMISLPLLFVGVWQFIFGAKTSGLWVSSAENLITNRAFGFFGSPNILAGVSMIMSVVALIAFLETKKWRYIVYELLSVSVLVFTFSRSAWVGFVIALLVVLVVKNWRLIFILPFGLLALIIPSIRQRLQVALSAEYAVDSAIDGRTWSLNTAMEIFSKRPILGTGPGSYGGQTAIYYDSPVYLMGMQNGYVALPYTDNQWLEILVQGGLLSIISVVGFFVSVLVNNFQKYIASKKPIFLGVIAVTLAVIIDGCFGNVWEFGATAVISGVYLGLGNSYEK